MTSFFKLGFEFNKLANSFGEMYVRINRLIPIVESNSADLARIKNVLKPEVLSLTHFAQTEIIQRMDKYGWELEARLIVNKISSRKISIMHAYGETINKLQIIVVLLDLQAEYEEIMK